MPNRALSPKKAKKLIVLYAVQGVNKCNIAKLLRLSRATISRYVNLYEESNLCGVEVLALGDRALMQALAPAGTTPKSPRRLQLENLFPSFHRRITDENTNFRNLWDEYRKIEQGAYGYSQFMALYHIWRERNDIPLQHQDRPITERITDQDALLLKQWRRSGDRSLWEKAVALEGLGQGTPITKISLQIERSCRTIKRWRTQFIEKGIGGLDLRRERKSTPELVEHVKIKKERLFRLIHESPYLHDFNRSSWSLLTLAQAFEKLHGESISKTTISQYIRSEGYAFKKARKVLTSPDPEYRHKLEKITKILSNLKPNEKFFSIDEFGPVAIKIRGGKALCRKEEMRTIPQRQRSKGFLICTAALELSTNQVTHFYSKKKDTEEMIALLELLLEKYREEERIFFSWDAASWHASKKLYKRVEEVNDPAYRNLNRTPLVELAPLPVCAQFLNVIESVFSGLARAVIHNSDYQSVDECRDAIDRYFIERNEEFQKHPKRAGKKIWGEETVAPVFSDTNNCKDRRWR